jgi:hypothetical protein
LDEDNSAEKARGKARYDYKEGEWDDTAPGQNFGHSYFAEYCVWQYIFKVQQAPS